MKLIAFDTSTASTVVVAADGERVAERRHDPVGRERPQHTTAALMLALEALEELGLSWAELDRVGVGVGPGTFTGLRSGLSAAAGLARRLTLPLVAVRSTLQLAHGARADAPESLPPVAASHRGVLAVVDGRRRELFVEAFPGDAGEPLPVPQGLTVVRRDDVAALPSLAGWLVVGDGALLEHDALGGRGATIPDPDDARHRIRGGALAALTASGRGQPADAVRPAYGRGADAVPTAERPVKPIPGGNTAVSGTAGGSA